MNDKANKTALEAAADGDEALLNKYQLADLPVQFAMRDAENGVIQEKEPCFLLKAPGFYGRGTAGTWYDEGSIIVTDAIPNQHMEPLNRAAGIRTSRWLDSLPQNQVPVDMGDISEAMTMLAARPDFLTMTPEQRSEAAMKFAVRLKMKREGRDARSLPELGHNFGGGTTKAPPILGAKMSDMAQRRPGETRAAPAATTESGGTRRANPSPAPAMAGVAAAR